jgi:hypothetical protein
LVGWLVGWFGLVWFGFVGWLFWFRWFFGWFGVMWFGFVWFGLVGWSGLVAAVVGELRANTHAISHKAVFIFADV